MAVPDHDASPQGHIVMTPGAKEYLGDDDVISALRRLRWGDYGYVRPEVVVSNDEIVASGMIEPLLGVYVMESGACVRVETYIGRYTTVLLPREARWWPIKEDDAQSSNATETLMNGEKTTAEEELTA